jgi:phage shock protein A
MGILTRMLTLWRADLHGVMDQIEDKPLLLKQYLREMEVDLRRKETRLEQLAQSRRQLQRDADLRGRELDTLEKDLDLALRKEKDEIAKMLIRKRRTQQALREQMQRQILILEEESEQLTETLTRQRVQYEQLKIKSAAACRQAEQARWDEVDSACAADPAWAPLSEEEIELELIQRKEAMQKGGAA